MPSLILSPIVTLPLAAPSITPGDFVSIDPNFIVGGDIVLRSQRVPEALEYEAFTGRVNNEVTGWIRKRQVAMVVCVVGDEAYLWAREGRGWIATDALVRVQDYPTQ